MDYAFLTSHDEPDHLPKVLVVYDDEEDAMWALLVKHKGASQEVVSWVLQKLEEGGHKGKQIAMKTDQEEAIMSLKKAIMLRRYAKTVPLESKVKVSQTNGRMERAVRKWRGQFRKIKLESDKNMHKRVDVNHPVVGWMVSWAADAVFKFKEKANGRTLYEEVTGHRVRHQVFGFGERIMFQLVNNSSDRNKFDGEWMECNFAGVITRSSEYIVIKDRVVFKCPTIRRRIKEEAYLKETLDNMLADHQEFILKGAITHRQHTYSGGKELTLPRPTPTARVYVPSGVRLTENDCLEFEFTQGCPGCAWYRDRIGEKRPHTKECRSRMVKRFEETEEGRERLSRARDRVDRYLQDHGPKDADETVEPTEKEEIKVEGDEAGHEAGKVQKGHEEFDMAIGSPTKLTQDVEMNENLGEGPTIVSESRHGSPARGGDMEDSIGVEEAMVQNSEKRTGTLRDRRLLPDRISVMKGWRIDRARE